MTSHEDTKHPVFTDENVPKARVLTGAELKSDMARMVKRHGGGVTSVVVPLAVPTAPVGVSSQLEHGPGGAAVTTGEAAASAAAHAVGARAPAK